MRGYNPNKFIYARAREELVMQRGREPARAWFSEKNEGLDRGDRDVRRHVKAIDTTLNNVGAIILAQDAIPRKQQGSECRGCPEISEAEDKEDKAFGLVVLRDGNDNREN